MAHILPKKKGRVLRSLFSLQSPLVHLLVALGLIFTFTVFFAYHASFSPTGFAILTLDANVSSEAYLEVDGISRGIPADLVTNQDGVRIYALSSLTLDDLAVGEHTIRLIDDGKVIVEQQITVTDDTPPELPAVVAEIPVINETLPSLLENISLPALEENSSLVVELPPISNISLDLPVANETVFNSNETQNATAPLLGSVMVLSEVPVGPVVVGQPVVWQRTLSLGAGAHTLTVPVYASEVALTTPAGAALPLAAKVGLADVAVAENSSFVATVADDATYLLTYTIPGPTQEVVALNDHQLTVAISSEVHYNQSVATSAAVPEAFYADYALYQLTEAGSVLVENVSLLDSDNNSLIDTLAWDIPHLSNQSYLIDLSIINPVSSPVVGGHWTVYFNTTGVANLTITAINGTSFAELLIDNLSTADDLSFADLTCANVSLQPSLLAVQPSGQTIAYSSLGANDSAAIDSFLVADYSCNGTAAFSNTVLTTGHHYLRFSFGGAGFNDTVQFAENLATCSTCAACDTAADTPNETVQLSANLTATSDAACISVGAGNVTIDCRGYTIGGAVNTFSVGVNVTSSLSSNINTTIRNCFFQNLSNTAVLIATANNVTLVNNTFLNNTIHLTLTGVVGFNATDNTFSGPGGSIDINEVNNSLFAYNRFSRLTTETEYILFQNGGAQNLSFFNNTFFVLNRSPISLRTTGIVYNLSLRQNLFDQIQTNAIEINDNGGSTMSQVEITGNTFRSINGLSFPEFQGIIQVYNSYPDVPFRNVIRDNNFTDYNHTAIWINNSNYLEVYNNTFSLPSTATNPGAGVQIPSFSRHHTIVNNTFVNPMNGILLEDRGIRNITIVGNNFSQSRSVGILLNNTQGLTTTILSNNFTTNASIQVRVIGPGPASIINNTFTSTANVFPAVEVRANFDTLIEGNTLTRGVVLLNIPDSSGNLTIRNNTLRDATVVANVSGAFNLTFSGNSVQNFSLLGFSAQNVTNVTLQNNNFTDIVGVAVYLQNSSIGHLFANTFFNAPSTLAGDFASLYMNRSFRFSVVFNNFTTAQHSIFGIAFNQSLLDRNRFNSTARNCLRLETSLATNVTNNTFVQCQTQGFSIDTTSTDLTFTRNNFTTMNGTTNSSGVRLNVTSGGNYWGQYDTPAEGCEDDNGNGYCDQPYGILNSSGQITSQDLLPFGGSVFPPAVVALIPALNSRFNTSQIIEIGANVTDNGGGIGTVLANITLSNGSITQLTLTNLTFSNKFNTSYTLLNYLGTYNVTFIANDTQNNVNSSERTNFSAADGTVPAVVALLPVNNSIYNTSNLIEVSANVTDNIVVHTVFANITLPNATVVQLTLTNATFSNKFNNSFTIYPNLIGVYNFTFFANDTSNNINSSERSNITVNDVTVPRVVNQTPSNNTLANAGSSIELAINVTDNVQVQTVFANVTLPNLTVQRVALSNNTYADKFNASFSVPQTLGLFNVTFVANDTSNNVNFSERTNFTAQDGTTPLVVNLTPLNSSSFTTLTFITISANVTDNIVLDTVFANVTRPNGVVDRVALTNTTYALAFSASYQIVNQSGVFNITLIANDTTNNVNSSETTNFTATIASGGPASVADDSGGGGGGGGGGGPAAVAPPLTGSAPAAATTTAAAPVPTLGGKLKLSFIDRDGLHQPVLDLRLDSAEFGGLVWRDISLRHLFAIDYVFALLLICTFAVLFSMLAENRVHLADVFYSFMSRFSHGSHFVQQQVYYHNHFVRALVRLDAAVAQHQIAYARQLYTSLALAYEDLESYLAPHDRQAIYAHLQAIYVRLIKVLPVTPRK